MLEIVNTVLGCISRSCYDVQADGGIGAVSLSIGLEQGRIHRAGL